MAMIATLHEDQLVDLFSLVQNFIVLICFVAFGWGQASCFHQFPVFMLSSVNKLSLLVKRAGSLFPCNTLQSSNSFQGIYNKIKNMLWTSKIKPYWAF